MSPTVAYIPSEVLEELGRRFASVAREALSEELGTESDTMKLQMIKASYGEYLLQLGIRALEVLPVCRSATDLGDALDQWDRERRAGFEQILTGIAAL